MFRKEFQGLCYSKWGYLPEPLRQKIREKSFYILWKPIYMALFWAETSTKKSTMFLVESNQNLEINKIQVARHIFAWEPGVLNIMLAPHENMPAYKKFVLHIKRITCNLSFFSRFRKSNRGPYFQSPYILPYLPHTFHTYPIPNLHHTYPKQSLPNLL